MKARYPLEQALKIQRDALGAHDTNTLFTMELLAQAMIDALQFGEADRYLDELRAIAASPDLPSDERRKVSNMLDALGTVRDGRMALNSRYGERGS